MQKKHTFFAAAYRRLMEYTDGTVGKIFSLALILIIVLFALSFLVKESYATLRIETKARTFQDDGNYKEAERILARGVALYPDSVSMQVALARAYLEEAQYAPNKAEPRAIEKARILLLPVEDGERHESERYTLLGVSHRLKGQNKKALSYLEKAVIVDTENAEAFLNTGMILAAYDETKTAQALFEKAEGILTDNPRADKNTLASAHIEIARTIFLLANTSKKFEDENENMRAYLEKALGETENRALLSRAHYLLSTIYWRAYEFGADDSRDPGDLTRSFDHAKKTIETNQDNRLGYVAAGRALIAQRRDLDEADRYLLVARNMSPNEAIILFHRGEIAFQTKRYDKALERFKAAVGLLEDGKDRSLSRNDRASLLAEIFYRASLIHIANGKQDRAVASLREGLRYDPARIKRYIESKKELESVRTYVSAE